MNKNQKGFAPILILAVISVLVIAGYFFVQRRNLTTIPSNSAGTQFQRIQNDNDLTKADNELNNTDTNQVDIELNQLSSDASAF
jgi:hypothetical protein